MEKKTPYCFNSALMWLVGIIAIAGVLMQFLSWMFPEDISLDVIGVVVYTAAYVVFFACLAKKFKEDSITSPSSGLIFSLVALNVIGTVIYASTNGLEDLLQEGLLIMLMFMVALIVLDIIVAVKLFKSDNGQLGFALILAEITPLIADFVTPEDTHRGYVIKFCLLIYLVGPAMFIDKMIAVLTGKREENNYNYTET